MADKTKPVDEFKILVDALGYSIYGEIDYKNGKKNVTLIDKDGYLLSTSYYKLKTKKPSVFHEKNPNTIYNIKLWINLNDKEITLISKNYNKSHTDLEFSCNNCGLVFKKTWSEIKSGYTCPTCKIGESIKKYERKSIKVEQVKKGDFIYKGQRIDWSLHEDSFKKMCIYSITNTINGKIYIGQTISFAKIRWMNHISNKKIYRSSINNAIKKYGESNFIFKVIDYGDTVDELNEKEIYWMNFYNSMSPNGYNLVQGGGNKITSQETIAKMSHPKTHRERMYTDEERKERQRVSARLRAKKIRDEKIASGEIIKRGLPKGYKRSKESVEKSSNAKKKKIIDSDGVVYDSIKEASEILGVNRTSILKVLNGSLKTLYGKKYFYHKKEGGCI